MSLIVDADFIPVVVHILAKLLVCHLIDGYTLGLGSRSRKAGTHLEVLGQLLPFFFDPPLVIRDPLIV